MKRPRRRAGAFLPPRRRIGFTPSDNTFAEVTDEVNQNFLGMAVLTAPLANALNPVQLNLIAGYNF